MKNVKDNLVDAVVCVIALCVMVTGVTILYGGVSELLEKPVSQYQSIKDLPKLNLSDADKNSEDKAQAMVALYRPDPIDHKMTFFCTAFVVSDKLAITAGHCLVDMTGERMTDDEIMIKDLNFKELVKAKAGAINTRADMGVIVGDFSKINKTRMNIEPGGFYNTQGPYLACGFAWGSLPGKCLPVQPVTNAYFQTRCNGQLYPGMSGGPVMDMSSGRVVAINAAVVDGAVIVTPTLGIIGALKLEVEGQESP